MGAAGFFSSFEAGDPVPTWSDTPDVGVDPGGSMRTLVGRGPVSAPAARPGVGFTGVRALRFHGQHTAPGRARVVNRIFWCDLPVEADTVLSYLIFPELMGGDLRRPSTYVAVDLAFEDGGHLSDLGAVDHLGFDSGALGQGRSKALYVDQWNRREVRIGAIAAGRTISRIVVGYEFPDGPAEFAGWIDDIAIRSEPVPAHSSPSDHVITTRGTHSTGSFSRGNTLPATAVPHGFNFWTPLTNASVTNWSYEYHLGSTPDNRPALQGFGCSHMPSPWMGDRHTVHVMPSIASGTPPVGRSARAMTFSHANETARPHRYAVRFDNGVEVEIAPTDHAAIFRFRYPEGTTPSLIFDNAGFVGGALTLESGGASGYSDVASGLSVGADRMFFQATVDRPVTASGRRWRGLCNRATGYLRFAPAESGPTTVTMRIATSLISLDQARANLDLEVAHTDFDTVAHEAKAAWDALLGLVEVDGASPDQLATLYGNLYRLFLYPNSGHENTGTAAEPVWRHASPVRPGTGRRSPTTTGSEVRDGRIYVNNGFWDTYRTCWPAYALLTPSRCGELIDGFLRHFRDGGWVSRWSSPGYADLMTGTSSDVAFADAYLKGVTGFDPREAYAAALRNATVTPDSGAVGRKGLERSIFLGYTPTSTHEGMSWSLEGCVNDFGIANLAHALGDRDNHAYFLARSAQYSALFDRSIGFFQGRSDSGGWRCSPAEYDPRVWGHDYTETNGWNMAFSAPHDGAGLAELYGGRDGLSAKLDEFFATPETAGHPGSYGRVIHEITEARDVQLGQYGHSNQPSHHIVHMYVHAGTPWKAQHKIREILARTYSGSEIGQGYCGDEDNGELSAWWLFCALGFYPLQVGSPYYVIGSPLFTRAVVHLENGRDLVVNAPANSATNVYVQGLLVDGEPWDRAWLPHDVLAAGAVLDFEMGPDPSDWGSGVDALPPSPGGRALRDVARSPDPALAALFDDTTRTECSVSGPVTVAVDPVEVSIYTITSGTGAAPAGWVLSGSADERTWTELDRRSGETFPWQRQTRAFMIETPGSYRFYRLAFDQPTRIAQVELLA